MIHSRCAACKYLRRKCTLECVFSPHFPPHDLERFVCVHRIFGASNVGKFIQQLPPHLRAEAAEALYYEAQCRIQDPVYGCAGIISQLHQQTQAAEIELAKTQAQLAFLNAHTDSGQFNRSPSRFHHLQHNAEASSVVVPAEEEEDIITGYSQTQLDLLSSPYLPTCYILD